jgi:hypothetical protein
MSEPRKFDPQYEVMVAKNVLQHAIQTMSDQLNNMRLVLARLQLFVDRQEELADDTDTISDKESGE